MFGLGVQEILVLCVVGLLLFGNRLPTLARSLGGAVSAFRGELRGAQDELHDAAP
jgi:sec-independent protein translocase protein TatA